ncbi:hypothetical protein [Roseovarius sp.]|uniref:hypothetical protein n=1 Tax=Roseovarius sp. TaxID=1486281 RepID=UPI00356A3318
MLTTSYQADALLQPGTTCWRVERASRAALIVDASDYFLHLRTALIGAEHAAYLIGWDFVLRIEMMPGQSDSDGNAPGGWPNQLGDFLKALVDRRPALVIHILKWDGAMITICGMVGFWWYLKSPSMHSPATIRSSDEGRRNGAVGAAMRWLATLAKGAKIASANPKDGRSS